ncbi:hypothetical protein [Candidatus Protochlamydia amoebophila]
MNGQGGFVFFGISRKI